MIASTTRLLIALLFIAGATALTWLAVIQPLSDWRVARFETQKRLTNEIAHLRSSIGSLEATHSLLSQDKVLDMIWIGDTSGEVAAHIQTEIDAAARNTDIELRSIAPVPAGPLPLSDATAFRIEGEAPLDHLAEFLRMLEFSTPALLIENATLRRLNRVDIDAAQPMIFVQMNVSAPTSISDRGAQ